jgi:hypothetical protein
VLIQSRRDRARGAARTELSSMMMQLQDEKEMQLREDGDRNRRRASYPSSAIPVRMHQGSHLQHIAIPRDKLVKHRSDENTQEEPRD